VAVDPRVTEFHRFRLMAEPTTQDAEALLNAWQFTPGDPITLGFIRPARIWRHALLVEVDWVIVMEEGVVLHSWTVAQVVGAVTKLAQRQGIAL
jgi:hypothetical protein